MTLEFQFPEQKDKLDEGFKCPCCGRYSQRYRRKLNTNMCMVLISLYKSNVREFVHVEKWLQEQGLPRSGDFHKLVHWGLLDKLVEDREDGSSRNGYYRLNGRSLLFVEGKLPVHEKAVILNGKFQEFEGELVTIQQCLPEKFNYENLMNGEGS